MESKKPLIIILLTVLVFTGCQNKEAELTRISELEQAIQETERRVQEEAKKAALADEARRLAEEKAAKEALIQKAHLAEIATLKASETAAKQRAEALRIESQKETARLRAESEAIARERTRLQSLREKEAAEATVKLKAAQMALQEAVAQGRTDVASAREEARKAAIEEMEARAAARGQMAMTEVVAKEREATPMRKTYTPANSPKTDTGRLAKSPALPEFPWPPPEASASIVIPNEFFTQSNTPTTGLKDVDQIITAALDEYTERRYYSVPNGFALVTRLEKINKDGTPKMSPERWETEMMPVSRRFSLTAYLKSLFTANPGYYRFIAFIVTSNAFSQSEPAPNRSVFINIFKKGENKLSSKIGKSEYSEDHNCTALIYEFEKPEHGDEPFAKPNGLPAKQHLQKSKIWEKLEDNYASFSSKL